MNESKPSFGRKHTFLRDNFAINFQAVQARNGYQTVNIEIAPAINQLPDWTKKTSLQLSQKDMYACFFQTLERRFFKYKSEFHGDKNNKSIAFDEGPVSCNVTLSDAGKVSYFRCSQGEWFYGKKLILEQMLNHPLSFSEAMRIMPNSWNKDDVCMPQTLSNY